jgi:hypothetical protein
MKLYELQIEDDMDEVFAISLVENPAIESDFIHFGKQKEEIKFAQVDKDQHMLIGAILIPDKHIMRVDAEGDPYMVYFTKQTVKNLAQNYLAKKYVSNATLEHESKIKGVTLVESWIKDGQLDKSNNYGLNLPKGTWVGMFKITDPKIWNDYVKTGKVQGFSIEGLFSHKLVNASKLYLNKDVEDLTEQEANVLLSEISKVIAKINVAKHKLKNDNRYKKGQRVDIMDAEGTMPGIVSSYPGQAATKKKKDLYVAPATLPSPTIGLQKKVSRKLFK